MTLICRALHFTFLACLIISISSCRKNDRDQNDVIYHKEDVNEIPNHVIVVAHRGDWRHAPENSLQAIKNCIALDIDMVELDVRMTRDSVFILMHDETVDRTTNGSGMVSELEWDYIKGLKLKDGLGMTTNHTVPRLEEALDLCKDQIMLNLDKSYPHIKSIYKILANENMVSQALFKGWMTEYSQVRGHLGGLLDTISFMPIIDLDHEEWQSIILSYSDSYNPVAFELIFKHDSSFIKALTYPQIKENKIWVNALWSFLNGGHDDELAITNPDQTYGWMVHYGVDFIQTDRPKLCKEYLENHSK